MAVEAAYVTAAEAGDEHAFDDFAADDAGESERERLFWFAVRAGEGRWCYALQVALGYCFGECLGREDGVLQGLATADAVALDLETLVFGIGGRGC